MTDNITRESVAQAFDNIIPKLANDFNEAAINIANHQRRQNKMFNINFYEDDRVKVTINDSGTMARVTSKRVVSTAPTPPFTEKGLEFFNNMLFLSLILGVSCVVAAVIERWF